MEDTSFISCTLNALGRLLAACLKNASLATTNQILFPRQSVALGTDLRSRQGALPAQKQSAAGSPGGSYALCRLPELKAPRSLGSNTREMELSGSEGGILK